ncbi:hypothetical protein [Peribacillus frigoritolerans]|uniref:hypothetical protein n=1 Tax=Peribacillus frigoritolerans TaxID=450367 RepID=UPI0020C06E18|nr:hypothetical protein [Peribacillus frigoritolerans]MEE3952200.1 hypothetical protein [Peribacillus frigoritolerans]
MDLLTSGRVVIKYSGTKFIPYSKEFAQKQVQKVQATITDIARSGKTTLKNIGDELGKKEMPKRISMEQVSLAGGPNLPQIVMEKQTIKEAYQKFTVKDSKVEGVSGDGISKGIEKGKNIKDYKKTFFDEYPDLKGSVVVHHAIEQQILKRHPNLFSLEEIHALENLRGIPKEVNSDIHLSKIRIDWNRFYRNNPNPTKEEVIGYMIELDQKYGENFNPPVKR